MKTAECSEDLASHKKDSCARALVGFLFDAARYAVFLVREDPVLIVPTLCVALSVAWGWCAAHYGYLTETFFASLLFIVSFIAFLVRLTMSVSARYDRLVIDPEKSFQNPKAENRLTLPTYSRYRGVLLCDERRMPCQLVICAAVVGYGQRTYGVLSWKQGGYTHRAYFLARFLSNSIVGEALRPWESKVSITLWFEPSDDGRLIFGAFYDSVLFRHRTVELTRDSCSEIMQSTAAAAASALPPPPPRPLQSDQLRPE